MKKRLLEYNLQFFAEDSADSVEMPEVAETVDSEETRDQESETELQQSELQPDINAVAAAARRQAESEARIRQERIDNEYAQRFGHLTNPITGQAIKSQKDYLDALDAQEQLAAETQLKQNGIDLDVLDQIIARNPTVRRAEEVIAQAQRQDAERQIMAHVTELSQLDETIKTFADVPGEVIQKAIETGMTLVDAYKIVNFGKISSAKRDAIQQAAINQAKGKKHLTPMNGVTTPEIGVDIPASELPMWKEAFPDRTMSELKKLYNNTL